MFPAPSQTSGPSTQLKETEGNAFWSLTMASPEFPQMMQFFKDGNEPSFAWRPLPALPQFPAIVHPVRTGMDPLSQATPLPQFLAIAQSLRVGVPA